jgi:predicted DNA-binding transcriptional regulator YafY
MPHIKNALLRYRIIDKCLRNKYRPFPTKQDLREACEESLFGSIHGDHICDSTIEKDMFSMKMDHDAPIKYNRLEKGYYYEDPDFNIDDIPLSEEDLGAISFAAKTLMQFRDVNLFRQFGAAIDKIVDRVEVSQDTSTDEFIQFEKSVSTGGNEHLTPLLESIKQSLWVTFDYASFTTGKKKLRKVIPLLLKEYRNRWYLISFDESKNNFITFGLDRLTNLKVQKEKADKPKDFDADNFFKHAVGITSKNELPSAVILKSTPVAGKYLSSQPLHSSQVLEKETENSFTFSLVVGISEELIREILSYGGEVKVVKPNALKKEIESRAKRILEE